MILHERVKGVTKPTRAKSGWAYRHRALLTRWARALTHSGLPLTLAADLIGLPCCTLCRWIGKDIRAEQKKKGAA